MKKILILLLLLNFSNLIAQKQPNIILVFADDISARELPIYKSNVWSQPAFKGDTKDLKYRAKTPVLDQLAKDGCWIKTAWAATICSPSRAMMMTGRYAHKHKWWFNGAKGKFINKKDRKETWPLYYSSPVQLGKVAQNTGYATFWGGKSQMTLEDFSKYGFDEGVFTPGYKLKKNPFTDFTIYKEKVNGKKVNMNLDTQKPQGFFPISSFYWKPSVSLMNHPSTKGGSVLWPNTKESIASYSVNTFAPDVELEYIFDFMDRSKKAKKPFFIYHTSHLGHGQFDWLNPEDTNDWPSTPIIKWDGKSYTRTEPNITGDRGVYNSHGTITSKGIHNHINYLDYQMWLYQNKLKKMGIAENTIIIFCADNGTHKYGKGSNDRQKGAHVPMIIYAPGMKKHGEQNIEVNIADILPTIAEIVGTKIPKDYEINGKSLVPYLFTHKKSHRKWVYSYQKDTQLVRGKFVMKDGKDRWWDISKTPNDLISYRQIKNWDQESEVYRQERNQLLKEITPFNMYYKEFHAPSYDGPIPRKRKKKN